MNKKGYGRFWDGTRLVGAHRWAYEHCVGRVPEGQMVLHHCDKPPCVRPDHLFLGDGISNAGDMLVKGRAPATWNDTSNFAGVSLVHRVINGRTYEYWRASIGANGALIYLGQFASEQEAAMAYDDAVARYGLKRRLNRA